MNSGSRMKSGCGIGLLLSILLTMLAANEPPHLTPEQLAGRAEQRSARGDLAGAMEDFTEAVQRDPSCRRAYAGRGALRTRAGKLDAAIDDFSRLIALQPKVSAGYFARGVARQGKGDYRGALADYT